MKTHSRKRCHRCNGQLFVDKDGSYWVKSCLQCGYQEEVIEIKPAKEFRNINWDAEVIKG